MADVAKKSALSFPGSPLCALTHFHSTKWKLFKESKDYVMNRIKSVENKINNENFIKRAPSDIVKHEQKKYSEYQNDYNKLKNNLRNLKS